MVVSSLGREPIYWRTAKRGKPKLCCLIWRHLFHYSMQYCSRWWFQIFFFIPKIGEIIQFDTHIFQMGWFNHQLLACIMNPWCFFQTFCLYPDTTDQAKWIGSLHNESQSPPKWAKFTPVILGNHRCPNFQGTFNLETNGFPLKIGTQSPNRVFAI